MHPHLCFCFCPWLALMLRASCHHAINQWTMALQENFRATAAALAAKYGVKAKNPYVEEEDEYEEGEEDEEGEEGESGEEGEEDEEEEGESGDEDEGEEEDDEEGEL